MFKSINDFFKKIYAKNITKLNPKTEDKVEESSKTLAKQRLHILLVQDRASVSADFIELMKQEIIDVASKYVVIDEKTIHVDMTNSISSDGDKTETGLFIKIPIINIRNEMKAQCKTTEEAKKEQELLNKKEEAILTENPFVDNEDIKGIDLPIGEITELIENVKEEIAEEKEYILEKTKETETVPEENVIETENIALDIEIPISKSKKVKSDEQKDI